MKLLYLFSFLLSFCNCSIAQNSNCTVLPDSLKGTYQGGCNKDKANGFGKAVGTDSYEGNFKNGFPDGAGKYTWKNGDYYDGNWKKGFKEGRGELHLHLNGTDSLITGYWKRGVYKGKYENAYIIHNTTTDIGRVQVSNMGGKQMSITVSVKNLVSNFSLYSNSLKTTTTMTAVMITTGSYMTKTVNTLTDTQITNFQDVIFPFRAYFYFGNSSVEIELLEPGAWVIEVPINK